jgi:hypothetical protein
MRTARAVSAENGDVMMEKVSKMYYNKAYKKSEDKLQN